MFNNLWYPKQSPLQGLGGLWGGNFGNLVAGGGGGALYDFADATFTALTRSKDGPSLSEARNLTSGTSAANFKNDTSFFNVSSGILVWTVPADGTYTIKCAGGRCGANYDGNTLMNQNTTGAIMQAQFVLTSGTYLALVVGSEGDPGYGNANTGSCAGGGTFVWDTSSQGSPYTGGVGGSTLLLSAGGAASTTPVGWTTLSTGQSRGQTATRAYDPAGGGQKGNPGTNGGGGTMAGNAGYDGGAGAGWTNNCTTDACGKRFQGGSDLSQSTKMHGGWGGGGGAHDNVREDYVPVWGGNIPWSHGRAGGGGYSGGAGAYYNNSGAGGASYCKSTAVANSLSTSDGNFTTSGSEHSTAYSGSVSNLGSYNAAPGYVTITFVG